MEYVMRKIAELTYNEIIYVSGGDAKLSNTVRHDDGHHAIEKLSRGRDVISGIAFGSILGLFSNIILVPVGTFMCLLAQGNMSNKEGGFIVASIILGSVTVGAVMGGVFGFYLDSDATYPKQLS